MLRGWLARLALAAGLFCIASAAHAELGRDDQWTYVPGTSEHGARAELRGDGAQGVPTQLIFQIECQRSRRTLIFRYSPDMREFAEPYPEDQAFDLALDGDERSFAMPRRPGDTPFQRRLGLTAEIAAAISGASEFWIYAPNESGHPWLGGRAPAFRRLVRECWDGELG